MKLSKAIGTIPISALKGAILSREDGTEMGYLGDITLELNTMILIVDLIDFKDHKSRSGLNLTQLLQEDYTLHLNGSSLQFTACDKDDFV
jgi:hypothetical protein